jgi:CheY-like chemotaxis protein
MMNDIQTRKTKVLIVDDDPVVQAGLSAVLEDDFEVSVAEDGASCLMQFDEAAPALIFLDIDMPGINGYKTCLKIRERSSTPIIFVSARDTLEERLHAFEVGGNDFIQKPFEGEILLAKAQRILALSGRAEMLAVEKAAMQKMALDLLAVNGDGNMLLNFMRDNLGCLHFEDLANSMLKLIEGYGLDCQIQLRHAEGEITLASGPAPTALEESILAKGMDQPGVFVFKQRLLINCPNISVLIPNMPADQDAFYRLKSNLITLTEATETIIQTVTVRRDATITTEQLQVTALDAHEATCGLQNDYHKQQADTQLLLHGLIDKLERSYFSLGLTEGQEERISSLLREETEAVMELFQHGGEALDWKFAQILEALVPPKKDQGDIWL